MLCVWVFPLIPRCPKISKTENQFVYILTPASGTKRQNILRLIRTFPCLNFVRQTFALCCSFNQSKDEHGTKKNVRPQHKHLQNQPNKPGGDAADVAAAGQGQHEGKNVAFRVHSVFMCAACSQKTVSWDLVLSLWISPEQRKSVTWYPFRYFPLLIYFSIWEMQKAVYQIRARSFQNQTHSLSCQLHCSCDFLGLCRLYLCYLSCSCIFFQDGCLFNCM